MLPETIHQEIMKLLSEGNEAQAKSLAFQALGNLSDADDYIKKHLTDDSVILFIIQKGNIVEAVKYVKDLRGWGLKESKDYVDKLRRA